MSRKSIEAQVDEILLMAKDGSLYKAMMVAAREGRLDEVTAAALGVEPGTYDCSVCGMRHFTGESADICCAGGELRYNKPPTRHDFAITNRPQLVSSMVDLAGTMDRAAIADRFGISVRSVSNIFTSASYVMSGTYDKLNSAFRGPVPGIDEGGGN